MTASPRLRFSALLLLSASAGAAPAAQDAAFLERKRNISAVVLERVRQAPDDAQRALKAGQERLRRLHQDYKVAKSTPPTGLDDDVRELTSAATLLRVARSRGQMPPADPRAERRIDALWDEYRARVDVLFGDIDRKRNAGGSEAAVYWDVLKGHAALRERLLEDMAYNAPPGERSLEESVSRDRWELLKRLEDPSKVYDKLSCVKVPEEGARHAHFDVAPFYRAAGLLPGTNPLRTGSFELPPGCRTVTQRESHAKLIMRARNGQGAVFIGQASKPLAYDYITVPSEAPYLVENRGAEPLDVEYIALEP